MIWCSHLFKNFPQLVVIHRVKDFSVVSEAEVDNFYGTSLLSTQSSECCKFDFWFLCFFETQLVHLDILRSYTAEA